MDRVTPAAAPRAVVGSLRRLQCTAVKKGVMTSREQMAPKMDGEKREPSALPEAARKRLPTVSCSKVRQLVRHRLPLLFWLPEYSRGSLVRDCLAGLTVALMAVPQAIAYGQLAGLPPHFGLYACLLPGVCYALFGVTNVVSIGPTAVMSILTSEFAGGNPQLSVFLAFFTGSVVLAAGVVKLGLWLVDLAGFLVDFFSVPVVSGFVSAASITICTAQMKGLLGIKGSSGKTMVKTTQFVFNNITRTKVADVLLGSTCIVALLGLKILGDLHATKTSQSPEANTSRKHPRRRHLVAKGAWVLSIARNAVVVLLTSVVVLVLEHQHLHPFSTTDTVAVGFPSAQLPPFSALAPAASRPGPAQGTLAAETGNTSLLNLSQRDGLSNETTQSMQDTSAVTTGGRALNNFVEICRELGIGLLVLPLVSVIECMAISKAFAARDRPQEASQELIAMGLCNLLGSFFASYTVTGSFSRTALNHASGAATPLAGVMTSVLVVVALGALTPYFRYIPTAALSAVIICAVVFMIDLKIALRLWKCRKPDLLPLLVTFFTGLLWRLEYGIILGTAVSLLLLLHRTARPRVRLHVKYTNNGTPYVLLAPDFGLGFPAADRLRERIIAAAWTPVSPSILEKTNHFANADEPPPHETTAAEWGRDIANRLVSEPEHATFDSGNSLENIGDFNHVSVDASLCHSCARPLTESVSTVHEGAAIGLSSNEATCLSPNDTTSPLLSHSQIPWVDGVEISADRDVVSMDVSRYIVPQLTQKTAQPNNDRNPNNQLSLKDNLSQHKTKTVHTSTQTQNSIGDREPPENPASSSGKSFSSSKTVCAGDGLLTDGRSKRENSGKVRRSPLSVVIDCRHVRYTDYTAAKSLVAASHALQWSGGRPLILLYAKPSVLAVWQAVDSSAFALCDSELDASQHIEETKDPGQ